jgi:ZIP family zinc transporter
MAASGLVLTAVLLGAFAVYLLNRYVPHQHFVSGREGPERDKVRRVWLFVTAITLHNIPEGIAVGVGYGGGDLMAGNKLAIAIGLQNAPEGLAVAAALVSLGYRPVRAFLIAASTGLIEAVGGLAGVSIVSMAEPLLPFGLGFGAGAMLFVISNEIIPETHRKGDATQATAGVMIGVIVMTFLDAAFG